MVLVQEPGLGSFGPKWNGPYTITRVVRPGTYRLSDQNGRDLGLPWNADHLKRLMTGHRPGLEVPDQDPLPSKAPNLCGSRTTELGLMTGHRPGLEVPDHDPLPSQAPTSVVLGPQN
ncbi:hypothetical protein TIFTF001_038253 [Ficus carica]|uniref:Uncharacterized protein n=1 Tax=Ficus carica TaxID=3494 RepID=A0AA88E8G7_FICCA|nr:hypothetical protein TIFTF001_038253 [Ficus carica]